MKKLFSILAIATLISCTTEDPKKDEPKTYVDCTCGIVTKTEPLSAYNLIATLKMNCDGSTRVITAPLTTRIGDKICK